MEEVMRTDRNFAARPSFVPVTNLQPEKPNSLYQLQDGRTGSCSDGDSMPDPSDLPNRVGIFMAETQAALHSSTAVVVLSWQMSQRKDLVVEPSRRVSLKGLKRTQGRKRVYTSLAPSMKVKAYV